jgi:23S rRNA (adenine2503-C2)-methyltransferase
MYFFLFLNAITMNKAFYQTRKSFVSSTTLFSNMNFYSTPEIELKELFKTWGQPNFRVEQLKKWVYERGVLDFDHMNDLPIDLRKKLHAYFTFGSLKLVSEQISKDGTKKRAYELNDGYSCIL